MINSSVLIAKQLALGSPVSSLSNLASNPTNSFIESLPLELKVKILSYLPLSNSLRTRQLSHSFKSSADNAWLWRQRLMQYFHDWQQLLPSEEIKQVVDNEDYKALFTQLYQQHFGKLTYKLQAFFQAVLEEDSTNIQRLLNSSPGLIDALSNKGDSALHYAARYGRTSTMRLLFELGEKVDVENTIGQSALHIAAKVNQLDVVNVLLSLGAEIDKHDSDDKIPLHYAIASGSLNCAYALLAKGASPVLHCAGWNALHTAAWYGQLDLIQHVLKQGVNLHIRTSNDGCTPLHLAAWNNQMAVVEYLLSQGPNVNSRNSDGFTPLHLAARSQHKALVEPLIQAGAKQSSKDSLGRTPSQLASFFQHHRAQLVLNLSQRITCM